MYNDNMTNNERHSMYSTSSSTNVHTSRDIDFKIEMTEWEDSRITLEIRANGHVITYFIPCREGETPADTRMRILDRFIGHAIDIRPPRVEI
jgi:hypothetical protein